MFTKNCRISPSLFCILRAGLDNCQVVGVPELQWDKNVIAFHFAVRDGQAELQVALPLVPKDPTKLPSASGELPWLLEESLGWAFIIRVLISGMSEIFVI